MRSAARRVEADIIPPSRGTLQSRNWVCSERNCSGAEEAGGALDADDRGGPQSPNVAASAKLLVGDRGASHACFLTIRCEPGRLCYDLGGSVVAPRFGRGQRRKR